MKRLENWTFRTLNLAARVVLLKSTIQVIPIYPLSVMAAPKGICNKLVEIYRKFLWGGPKQQKKWALCSWDSLTKPKEKGGLGLRDPWTLNQVLAAKLRWRWMQGGKDLWKEIWTSKYNMPDTLKQILRKQEAPRGSDIWNLTIQNRELNDAHIFWEIREGQIVIFWEEPWQQREKMLDLQGMQEIYRMRMDRDLILVKDYWTEDRGNVEWREWKPMDEWSRNATEDQKTTFSKELDSRKIKKRQGRDILRWGKETKGAFTIREAYKVKIQQEQGAAEEQKWRKIWRNKWWPKIKMFVWLVGKKRILTWDRIQKRGFSGPSRCSLCQLDKEDQEHLLNGCSAAQFQWEKTRNLFSTTDRNPQDIIQTLCDWGEGKFKSRIVRRAWNLTAGFNVWNLWKERNSRIFKGKASDLEEVWKRTLRQIRESILAENWAEEDWNTSEEETEILKRLNLDQGMIYHQKAKQHQPIAGQSHSIYQKSPEGFIKLNFDGAAKGNPGPAGFGGVFRNRQGEVEWIYAEHGGTMTNNEAEFMAVYQGLKISIRNGYKKIKIEGDSALVISTIRKLIQGKQWEKVVKSWRTASVVQEIEEALKGIEYKITSHVRREGNKPAFCLANWEVKNHWRKWMTAGPIKQ